MTVATTANRVTYTGDGSTTAFPVSFPFYDNTDLVVIERVISTGAETTKTLTTHYTVSGGSGSTGTVTAVTAPASTVQWIIKRVLPITQSIDYTPNDPFPASTHEEGLDRGVMRDQQLDEELDRSIKFPATDSTSLSPTLPSSIDRASKYFAFDANGEPIASTGPTGDSSIPVSAYIETLLDDSTAAAARTTLGLGSMSTTSSVGPENLDNDAVSYGMALHNGRITASVGSNALTIAIKTLAGNDPSSSDPVRVIFQDETQATGAPDVFSITAASSLVISSGSTLGFSSGTAGRVWVVLFNDGGTLRLGAINALSGTNIISLDNYQLASSTAEGGAGAADSAQVFYTGTAVTSKPYRIVASLTWNSGLTTAGTWDAAPSVIHQFGVGSRRPGDVVSSAFGTHASNASTGTSIPADDTIPQSTEGLATATATITAASAANVLEVEAVGNVFRGGSNEGAALALFRTGTADAKAVTPMGVTNLNPGPVSGSLIWRELVTTAGSVTYTLNVGTHTTTNYTNGLNSGRLYGGVSINTVRVKEIVA